MEPLVASVLISLLWGVSGYFIRGAIDAHRHRKAAEKAAEEFAARMSFMARVMAETMGAVVGTRVEPHQIKTGDRIHWHERTGGEGCVDYTAGFNGDTAGKTTGEWIKRSDR